MSVSEFMSHYHDYLRNPWGPDRDAMHAAMIARTVSDYAGKTRKGDPAKLSDFIIDFDRKKPEAVVEADPIAHFKHLN